MLTRPGLLLRLEGAALFLASVYLYRTTGSGWLLFVALFLWPDLSMLGYLLNVRLGATLYNLVHTETLPILLAGTAVYLHNEGALAFAMISLAHIGWDRVLGYGLKYPTFFKDTHLQRVNASLALSAAAGLPQTR